MIERNVWIPRNLAEEDSIKFAAGIRVRPSDIPIMGMVAGAITPAIGELDDIYKYGAYLSSLIFAYVFARINYRGQDLPELLLNGIVYGCRKRNYARRKK